MLYFKYLKMLIKSTLEYQSAFWMTVVSQFLVSFFSFFGMYSLFDRFGNINGWTFGEVALCFAAIQISFSVTECFARGFDSFSHNIISGDFDRILTRPRSTLIQVLGSEFALSKIGRLFQSVLVLAFAISQIEIEWNILQSLTLVFMIIGGIFIFAGIFILGATVCFFTVQGLEFINIFTDGGREIASYPLSIYSKWAIQFFTFIIPLGCVNYIPLLYITGRVDEHSYLYMLTPLLGILFVLPCLWVWQLGVKRYLSTGN